MDDGDDFLDDVDFEELERAAIQATQHATSLTQHASNGLGGATSSTRPTAARAQSPSSDYGLDDEEHVVDLDTGEPANQLKPPQIRPDVTQQPQGEVEQREQWRQQRYAGPGKLLGSQNNGTWQQSQVPLRASQSRPATAQRQPQYRLTRPTQPSPDPPPTQSNGYSRTIAQPLKSTLPPQHTASEIQPARAAPSASGDVSVLQARIAELEAERLRLQQATEESRSALYSKAGEISIVRANYERTAKEYEQKLSMAQVQHAEEMAKQKAQLEAIRKEMERSETDRRFLEHDLREETKKKAALMKLAPKTQAVSPAVTPRKTRAKKMGDGFDDDEVMLVSPSKSRERRDRGTPTQNGQAAKRKRLVQSDQASPSKALPLSESAETFEELRTTENSSLEPLMPIRPKLAEDTSENQLQFVQIILDHRHDIQAERTIERLTKYAFPSNPHTSISSLIYDFFVPTRAEVGINGYRLGFCEAVLRIWSTCMEESYYAPLADLHALLMTVLIEADSFMTGAFVVDLVSLCLKTADLIAFPTVKAYRNPAQHQPPSAALKAQIKPLTCIEMLESVAVSCYGNNELLSVFWSAMEFDNVLVLLQKAQPLLQLAAMLRLLSTSIIPDTFGPRAPDSTGNHQSTQQLKYQSDLLDRLTVMLLENLEAAPGETPYTSQDILSLRSSALELFRQMCLCAHGGHMLATHRLFIGRLVRFIHESIVAMYAYEPDTHDRTTDLINQSVRLLAHLTAVHAGSFDLRAKVAAVPGGAHMHLVALSKLAFVEGVSVLERGIAPDVAEAAHRMLDEHLSPEEGEAVVDVFSSARG